MTLSWAMTHLTTIFHHSHLSIFSFLMSNLDIASPWLVQGWIAKHHLNIIIMTQSWFSETLTLSYKRNSFGYCINAVISLISYVWLNCPIIKHCLLFKLLKVSGSLRGGSYLLPASFTMSLQLVKYLIHACLIVSGRQYSLLLHFMCYTLISKSNVELLNQITTYITQEFSSFRWGR